MIQSTHAAADTEADHDWLRAHLAPARAPAQPRGLRRGGEL